MATLCPIGGPLHREVDMTTVGLQRAHQGADRDLALLASGVRLLYVIELALLLAARLWPHLFRPARFGPHVSQSMGIAGTGAYDYVQGHLQQCACSEAHPVRHVRGWTNAAATSQPLQGEFWQLEDAQAQCKEDEIAVVSLRCPLKQHCGHEDFTV